VVPKVQPIFTIMRTSFTLLFLLYASWSDYKTREVSNNVWLLFAPLAFALTMIELFLYDTTSNMLSYGICFGLTSAFAVILFYSGGFGGADAKALMCLALALPFYPENLFAPFGGISVISQSFFPITVFTNSVLLAAATAVYVFLRNIIGHLRSSRRLFEDYENESLGRKILVLITGYKVSVAKLKEKWHVYPLEDIVETNEDTPKRKLVLIPKDENRNAIVERLAKAVEAGKINDAVWATPGLPMLIFITAGLIAALFFGDVVWICIRLLLG
jgi:preflagellin peptidase FlaK